VTQDQKPKTKDQTWFAAEIKLQPQAVEAIEFALSEAGAEGTEYSTLGQKEAREIVTVIGYFSEKPDVDFLPTEIAHSLKIYELPSDSVKEIAIREVENRDWLEEWKKNWKPTEAGCFIVAPSWSEITASKGKIVLRVEPGMAFGTGTHETTKLCLRAIEKYYDGGTVFDVGTGTGILAIAAAKFYAISTDKKIWACDTDADSVKIAQENAELNGVSNIEFFVGSIAEDSPEFDFVLANLTADVIVPLLPLLMAKTKKILILSGILVEQQNWVLDELKKLGKENSPVETDGMWVSIMIHR
jgi:ribosomal protein L11 methyltransferase